LGISHGPFVAVGGEDCFVGAGWVQPGHRCADAQASACLCPSMARSCRAGHGGCGCGACRGRLKGRVNLVVAAHTLSGVDDQAAREQLVRRLWGEGSPAPAALSDLPAAERAPAARSQSGGLQSCQLRSSAALISMCQPVLMVASPNPPPHPAQVQPQHSPHPRRCASPPPPARPQR